MTIEQKAKAYDEALERARIEYKNEQSKGNIWDCESLSTVFPELKESEDERIRKAIICGMYALKEQHKTCFASIPIDNAIAWLEKQYQVKESTISQYEEDERIRKTLIDYFNICHGDYYGELKRKDILAWLEKQGEQKGYTFKSIPRLLDMIEPSDKANAYCQKLIDALAKEGYNTDAKIVEEVLKGWNGEDVPIAVMDEQKPFDYENANIQQTDFAPKVDMPRYSIGDVLCDKSCTTLDKEAQPNFEIIDIRNGMYICDKCSFPISQQDEYELVAKKIEQKSTDEIEPKFNVGDWIVFNGFILHIDEVVDGYYRTTTIGGIPNSYDWDIDNVARLWSIQDAKEGDVLACNDNPFLFLKYEKDEYGLVCFSYCGISNSEYGKFAVNTNTKKYWCDIEFVKPATKEQRDLLFQKMRESGYEGDAEEKELKEINSYCQEHCKGYQETGRCFADGECEAKKKAETAWSEEDEEIFCKALYFLDAGYNHFKCTDGIPECKDWLKSLKQRIKK